MAQNEKSITELLTDLDEHIIKHGAIVEAATDYVTLKEKVKAMPNVKTDHTQKLNLAYKNLRELVITQ